jgi:AraC family transcriptional regulator
MAATVGLDDSKVNPGATFKGLEIELHRFGGARVLRVVHPGAQQIPEHRHDWPYIGLYTAGRYRERYDGGEAEMHGPCAVLHPAGRPHADTVETEGLETLTIEFDPAWLRRHGFGCKLDRSRVWSGGQVGLASRKFAGILTDGFTDERSIGSATAEFLNLALADEPCAAPSWVAEVREQLDDLQPVTADDLARRHRMHPAYLARAYRRATGEGIAEVQRRRRVEAASRLLRFTAQPLAEIAVAAGFCDQSHMNRCFRAVLGRTPLVVRGEIAGAPLS